MKFTPKYLSYPNMEEYYCNITSELDKAAGFDICKRYKHYILADGYGKNNGFYAIRVPGGTLGAIYFDNNNLITKITIDTNYVVKTYPSDVLDQLQKYVGQKIEF